MSKPATLLSLSLATIGALALFPRIGQTAGEASSINAHAHRSDCADACAFCANSCNSCAEHCLLQLTAGKTEHAATLRLCNDCADLCSLAARIESRQGPLAVTICGACADACDRCAAECGRFPDQPHMIECAKSCQVCAAACREMIQQHGSSR